MTKRTALNRNVSECRSRFLPVTQLAILFALSVSLWFGTGCTAEDTGGDTPIMVTAHTTQTSDERPTQASAMTDSGAATPAAATTLLTATTPATPEDRQARAPTTVADEPTNAMSSADFPVPPERDLRLLAQQMRWKGAEPPAAPASEDLEVGETRDFWTMDYPSMAMVSSRFRLAAISDGAYWWVGEDTKVETDALSRTIEEAEGQVFPRVEAVFADGSEPDRLNIISGRIPGVGGYVSGNDLHPQSVNPYSNEVPAVYINTRAAGLGEPAFLRILAHELQHAIHQNADESEATWLNEGLAELAVTEAGYRAGSISGYLRQPNASLINWPDHLGANVGLNYGASALFAQYLREKYAPDGGLQDLLAIEADGIAAVEEFLSARNAVAPNGGAAEFHTVFAEWMVANRLDLESSPYGYDGLEVEASITRRQRADGEGPMESLAQYGIDYVEIQDAGESGVVHFEGSGTTSLLATDIESECWWSNRGDSISATLTRHLRVPTAAPDGSEPILTYRYWHDIEEEWDYLYVSVSKDDGKSWETLKATGTTDANPVGNSYGYGYTGDSKGWQDGEASLAPYAGRNALVRFHYVTDDAINGPGFCVQGMRVSGDELDSNTVVWEPEGFVSVNNRVQQDWIVWVLGDGPEPTATRMSLQRDPENDAYAGSIPMAIAPSQRLVVAVAPTAPATMEEAQYRLWVESGN